MIEVEVKAISNKQTKQKIKEKGEFLKKEHQKDIYLNHPNRDFAKTDEALRLRKVDDKIFLTYKGPKIDDKTKSREEIEEEIEELDKSLEIFKSLGFNEAASVEKTRETYVINSYKASIDKVKGLGEFIEIEKEVKEADNEIIKRIIEFFKKLGIKEKDLERRSYLELLLSRVG